MLKTVMVAARDRERLTEIGNVAARYGLGILLARFGIAGAGGEDDAEADLPARTRRALEELGPTFVKLGQILATRRDILPPDWVAEFEKLQSQAPTLPFEDLRGAVEQALGEPPESAFAQFDTTPLAAASIAQVHRATLKSGQEVAVKIRRPGIRRRMEADLRLIHHLADMAQASSRDLRRMRAGDLVRQLAREVLDEIDFTVEARNAERLREDLADNDRVLVPAIHWEWTSESLLVMDFIAGVPPRDGQALRDAGIDPDRIARLGAELVLEMVLVNGRFHGDPHPGNLLCLPGDRLALLDLGSIGYVSPRRQQEFLAFLLALRRGDPDGLAETLGEWSQGGEVPEAKLRAASERLVARHGDGPLVLDALMADFFPLLRKEGLVLPPELLLIFKAMVTMDGVLNAIAPGFDLAQAVDDARGRLLASRLTGKAAAGRVEALALEAMRLGQDAPRLIRALSRRLESDQTNPSYRDMGQIAGAIRHAGWAVAGALVFGAVLIGTLPVLL